MDGVVPPWESKDASYVDSWFLMGSPAKIIIICVSYLVFVLKLGPYLMKDRQPFQLKNVILTYNILQVIYSAYLFKLATVILYKSGLSPDKCVDESPDLQYEFYFGTHIYTIAKLTELLDTVFFVLRKKYNQVSVLHVYHHCGILLYSWAMLYFKFTALSIIVLGFLNTFVHLVMYSYYAVSTFPEIAKYIWWKKYITKMQMIQFVLIMMYVVFEYCTSPCLFSNKLLVTFLINLSLVLYLFMDFYKKSYKSAKNK
ncbi:elongation of very long chain fatty acids protein AAEL008004-like [Aricia agestis]|uniref:elongation of very long chain fatty acids protein AAEL008004-like n=1 Tax=Aricia agestis TaxID=91739 RepID=UPI001C20A5AD|nr:elongation of very long chain fatty acids protein AAEL008004-like [Aricia agestis]